MSEAFNQWVKQPIANKTKQLEDSATSQFNTCSAKTKKTAYKPEITTEGKKPFTEVYFGLLCCV